MKKSLSLIVMLLAASYAMSQENTGTARIFKPFKVDVAAGFGLPLGGNGAKGGALFAVEPKFGLSDKFVVGLRMELAALARVTDTDPNNTSGEAQGNGSFTLTGDYLFTTNSFRPFLGAGVGMYQVAAATIVSGTTSDEIETANKAGFMIRGGFETGHFRFGVEYNIVGSTSFSSHNDYIGFKIGGFFGGGRLKK